MLELQLPTILYAVAYSIGGCLLGEQRLSWLGSLPCPRRRPDLRFLWQSLPFRCLAVCGRVSADWCLLYAGPDGGRSYRTAKHKRRWRHDNHTGMKIAKAWRISCCSLSN
jgi:hypothetical protein